MTAVAPKRWLFGPVPDLLFGCGLLYAVAFVVFCLKGADVRAAQPALLLPLLVLMFSSPHYGATLLRVYEQRDSRREYALFSVYATVLVGAAFVFGVYRSGFAAWMVTLYLTWSPWHYTGQNYGLAMMFLRRRGVPVTQAAKRWLYSSFVLSFALTFLVMHGETGSAADIPVDYSANSAITFQSLGIPHWFSNWALPLVAGCYAIALLGTAAIFLRRARAIDLLPSAGLVATQALWFSVPFVAHHYSYITGLEPIDWQFRTHYFLWIALGHAIQYLWITTYFARSSKSWTGYGRYYAKTLAAGNAIWTVPVLLFGPGAAGSISVDAGLALQVAAAVNVHHFILDGAIWKLRNSKIARVLLRAGKGEADTGSRSPGMRRLVWAVAFVMLAIGLAHFWSYRVGYRNAYRRGDYESAARALDRLAWAGYDRARDRYSLGRRMGEQGNLDGALINLERSIELTPSAEAHDGLGIVHSKRRDWEAAAESFMEALAYDPENLDLLARTADVLARSKRPGRALPYLRKALKIQPDHARSLATWEFLNKRKASLPPPPGKDRP